MVLWMRRIPKILERQEYDELKYVLAEVFDCT